VGKQCLGWEDVQLLDYEAVRLLVALGWVAAGFLYELGGELGVAGGAVARALSRG
jgi:hypothetical protein